MPEAQSDVILCSGGSVIEAVLRAIQDAERKFEPLAEIRLSERDYMRLIIEDDRGLVHASSPLTESLFGLPIVVDRVPHTD